MAKIIQVRLVEGEVVIADGVPTLEVLHEIDEYAVAYDATAVAALRFGKLAEMLRKARDAGEDRLERPNVGGRPPRNGA